MARHPVHVYVAGWAPAVQTASRYALGLVTASLLTVAAAMPAGAAAITRGTITTPTVDTGLTDDCRPGITGILVATDILSFQTVDEPAGFHFDSTDTATGQITWTDGTYSIIESVDLTRFNTGPGATVLTIPHEDSVNTYTADGVFIYRLTFHNNLHFTRTADGVVRVSFERGHFHTFGAC